MILSGLDLQVQNPGIQRANCTQNPGGHTGGHHATTDSVKGAHGNWDSEPLQRAVVLHPWLHSSCRLKTARGKFQKASCEYAASTTTSRVRTGCLPLTAERGLRSTVINTRKTTKASRVSLVYMQRPHRFTPGTWYLQGVLAPTPAGTQVCGE